MEVAALEDLVAQADRHPAWSLCGRHLIQVDLAPGCWLTVEGESPEAARVRLQELLTELTHIAPPIDDSTDAPSDRAEWIFVLP